MKIRDLGDVPGPLTVFGGAYSNLQAVEALLGQVTGPMLNTGDLMAYCADGAAVVEVLRNVPTVAGNMERQLAADAQECGCGFEDGSACAVLSGDWYAYAQRTITASGREVMAACPDIITFAQAGRRFAAIHGGATEIARFLWEVSPETAFAEEIAAIEAVTGPIDAVLAGHCGIGFRRQVAGRDWINAGVIGMPENDGRTETRYVVLEDGEPHMRRLSYDFRTAAARMRAKGLPEGYAAALETGYWPNEDVLPDQMRR